jgi:hypothetical protein
MRRDLLEVYDRYEDIPDDLDHVIEFVPVVPPPPHTDQQHEEIHAWRDLFLKLMEKAYGKTSSKIGRHRGATLQPVCDCHGQS